MNLVMSGSGCQGFLSTQPANSKLPDAQVPQISNLRPISERPSHIEDRKQMGHWEGNTAIGAAYFADPCRSLQRGSNTNLNGLLRQYIPKKRRMKTVTDEELTVIENRLNHRPRKRMGFKTVK